MSDEIDDDIVTIERKEIEQYINRNEQQDYKNPSSDMGHSYSYGHKIDDKIKANFNLTEPKLESLINKYQSIIIEDPTLYKELNNLHNLFLQMKKNHLSKYDSLVQEIKNLFNIIFELVERIAEEEQRIDQESPLSKDSTQQKSTEFFDFKLGLMQIKESCFTIY